jgi:pyruvate/2-oxoglutarate dehydrogenase complex dihydrolipoamide acyltransferase (E2) component
MSTSTTNIALPELPGGEATVLRRLVEPGAEVAAGTPLLIVRTEREEVALPTPTAGRVAHLAALGATLGAGVVLAQIDGVPPAEQPMEVQGQLPSPTLRATPTARRIALLNEIDLHTLTGSGADGRVVKADVVAVLGDGDTGTREPGDTGTTDDERPTTVLRPTDLKQPVATAMVEADVSAALVLIAAQEATFARLGLAATLITIVAQAAAELLPHYPLFNAAYSDSGIIRRRSVHLAVGTSTAGGLRWAWITHAGDLTLRGMARALRDAPPKGDCTFAVLSLPASNGYSALPPLPGTGALLAVGVPTQRAVVLPGDRITVRPVAALTLSYDARLATYAEAGCFLSALRRAIER